MSVFIIIINNFNILYRNCYYKANLLILQINRPSVSTPFINGKQDEIDEKNKS